MMILPTSVLKRDANVVASAILGAAVRAIDYSQAIAYIDAGSAFQGSATNVTAVTATGRQGLVFAATGSGNPITHGPEGFTFADGFYLQCPVLSGQPTGDGIFAVIDFTLTSYGSSSGYLLQGAGSRLNLLDMNGSLRVQGVEDTNVTMTAGATPYGTRFVIGGRIDDLADMLRMYDLAGAYSEQPIGSTNPDLTRVITGRYLNGTLHRLAVFGRPEGGAWPVSFEDVCADFSGIGAPVDDSITTMNLLQARGQSLSLGPNIGALFAPSGARWRDALRDDRVRMLTGLQRADGIEIINVTNPLLQGYNQSVPATGDRPMVVQTSVPTGTVIALQLAQDRQRPREHIGFQFHDAGGQTVQNLDDDPATGQAGIIQPYQNAGYWTQQAATIWGDQGLDVQVRWLVYDQGEADVSNARGWFLDAFDVTYGDMVAQAMSATGQSAPPLFYMHQTGGYMLKNPESHWCVLDQLDAIIRDGGILVGPGWTHLIDNADGRGVHMSLMGHMQRALLAAWAIVETEAGRSWNLLPPPTVERIGNQITIPLSCRPDEVLTTAAGKYAAYGGDPINLGLDAVGGGAIVSARVDGSNIMLEVSGPVTAVRHAFQTTGIDYRTLLDADGCGYATHRGLIRTTLTRSVQIHGLTVQLERFAPSFEVQVQP